MASSTGSLDGLVNVIGLFVGILIFGELYPYLEEFYTATPLGQITMVDFFDMPAGILVFLLVLLALGGFWLSEKLETRYNS